MRKPLFIYGAGGLGREILALIRQLEAWEPKGFLDDGIASGTMVNGLEVIGGIKILPELSGKSVVIALGHPLLRQKIALQIPSTVNCPVIVHPKATLLDASSIDLGKGCIITAGAVLTCNIILGDHVLVNLNATIGHDTTIGSYSSIMPGVNLAGQVTVGESVLLGSGCNIRNRVKVGSNSQVGMGAVVLKDVPEGVTFAGVPAKQLSKKE